MWVVLVNTQFATITEKTIFGVHVSPGSAETLVRTGRIKNHLSIAYSLSNISAKNYQNQLMCTEVTVCNISVIFIRHNVDTWDILDASLYRSLVANLLAPFTLFITSEYNFSPLPRLSDSKDAHDIQIGTLVYLECNSSLKRSGMARVNEDHIVLPATHTFIHKWNEPHLPLLPSCRASPHFGWYSFPVPGRVGGWVGPSSV